MIRRTTAAVSGLLIFAGLFGPSSPAAGSPVDAIRLEMVSALWIPHGQIKHAYFVEARRLVHTSENRRVRSGAHFFKATCNRIREDLLCEVRRIFRQALEPQDFVVHPDVGGARLTLDQGGMEHTIVWSSDEDNPPEYGYGAGDNDTNQVVLWQWNWPHANAEGTLFDRRLRKKDTRIGSIDALTAVTASAPSPSRPPRKISMGNGVDVFFRSK